MFGPNQVGELMVGNAVATETTSTTFIATATDKELKVLSKDGTNVGAGKPFYVLQKATAAAGGFEFSDVVDPRCIDKITVKTYSAEVQRQIRVNGFTPAANTTYEVNVRLYNDGGSLSPENFSIIQGFYATGSDITAETATTIRDGVMASLQKNIDSRGGGEFVLAPVTGPVGFTITSVEQDRVAGKIMGYQLQFDVTAKSLANLSNYLDVSDNTGLITVVTVVGGSPGNSTGKRLANYEWFVKGVKYPAERYGGWPADFMDRIPFYVNGGGIYNVIQIKYFDAREETSVERQYKVLSIAVEKAADTLANNAGTNSVLADIRTAVSTFATVPANLAVA